MKAFKARLVDLYLLTLISVRAFKQYVTEYRYFMRAKRRFRDPDYPKANPNLFLRKRTHHLERFLFHPDSYAPLFAQTVSGGLEKVLAGEKALPPAQERWARRILGEYQSDSLEGCATLCPVMEGDVRRKKINVGTDALLHLIRQRRSRRFFEDRPLTDGEKKLVCEAAQFAPSSCNRQTLYLIFVEDPKLKEFVASTVSGGHQFFATAPAIVVFVSDAGDYNYPGDRAAPYIDAAAAVQNVYLICETMGLGCCWGSYTSFGGVLHEREVRSRLNIPDSHLIVAAMAIGESKQFVCHIPRDNPQDRFWNNRYGLNDQRA